MHFSPLMLKKVHVNLPIFFTFCHKGIEYQFSFKRYGSSIKELKFHAKIAKEIARVRKD